MESVFELQKQQGYLSRLKQLDKESTALWGQMDAAQMLAHLNASYEFIFEPSKNRKPNLVVKLVLRLFVKPMVVSKRPFKRNLPTTSALRQQNGKDFERELARLRAYLIQVDTLGYEAFDGKKHAVFGRLSARQWNQLLGKHLNHHLTQFGV